MAAFDSSAIEAHGWRQGSLLGAALAPKAFEHAPAGVIAGLDDWLIVTSHDCDVVNGQLDKEPFVEVLRASVVAKLDKHQAGGRNPRVLRLEVVRDGATVTVSASVHDRWRVPRQWLVDEKPDWLVPGKERRLISEWLAKRYIRSAFPTAFDQRWRDKIGNWTKLLASQSRWIQGVYLRPNTLSELGPLEVYKVSLIVAAPKGASAEADWPQRQHEIGKAVEGFWRQFGPGIEFVEVDVVTTAELTLAEVEPYQRFDADWVSFADDTPVVTTAMDMLG